MSATFKERTARKEHRCTCGRVIRRGERYRLWTAFPHDADLGNEGFYSLNECADCAKGYGRPVGQVSS